MTATPFRIRGVDSVSKTEFIYSLSSDRDWCTPSEAEEVLDTAIIEGLVIEEGGDLRLCYDPGDVTDIQNVDVDEVLAKPQADIVLERVVQELVSQRDYSRKEAVAAVNREHHKLGNVDVDAAAVIVAKREGLDVERYVELVLEKLRE